MKKTTHAGNYKVFTIIDDEGKLHGLVGATYEMTPKQVHLDSGISLSTIYKRLTEQGRRKWSELSMTAAQAKARARNKSRDQLAAIYAEHADARKKKRAHEERVLMGNKDL